MANVWILTLGSVIAVSLVSLIGIVALRFKEMTLKRLVIYLVSFSAGALLGDVFIHLLPEAFDGSINLTTISLLVLMGIIASFVLEKVVCWRHCHIPTSKEHQHPFAYVNLFGDFIHNFIDGIIIASSYLVNTAVGISTTFAVMLHEIPQEMGDFGVLIHAGFSRKKAIFFNFLVSLSAIAGAVITILLATSTNIVGYLIPFAAGNFLYLSLSDLFPEIQKETETKQSVKQLAFIALGVLIMATMLLLE